MSENRNRNTRDFSKYDAMDTQALEEILRLDSEALQEQESDTELILYVMEVLASRKNANSTGKTALEAWESFQKNYLPDDEDHFDHTSQTEKPIKTARPWLRRLTAAAAAMALLVGLSVTANAFGWEDIWNAVAKWAKETFSFVSSGDTELTEPKEQFGQEYTSLQEAFVATDLDCDCLPTWVPDGYTLEKMVVDENPMQRVYIAQYKCGEKELIITVRSYLSSDLEVVEMNDELLEMYDVNGIQYHIFYNNEQLCTVWMKDSYECRIAGELTVEEIKTIIDSIGKE